MTKIHDAIIFAARKHSGQMRKGTDIPYISHPMEVMDILREDGCPEHVIIAGILHDTLEDTGTTPEEIKEKFGDNVLRIVQAESEDKSRTWKERKQATIDHLGGLGLAEKQVCCADKLSNLRSMYADRQEKGEELWDRFNAPKADIRWYYEGIRNALRKSLAERPMFQELDGLIPLVFGE
jgi:(p)ppGpp synthase/HD superfamily hydrolase